MSADFITFLSIYKIRGREGGKKEGRKGRGEMWENEKEGRGWEWGREEDGRDRSALGLYIKAKVLMTGQEAEIRVVNRKHKVKKNVKERSGSDTR